MNNEALKHLISLADAANQIAERVPSQRDFEYFEAELVKANNYISSRVQPLKLHFTLPLTEGKTRSNLKGLSSAPNRRPHSPPPSPTTPKPDYNDYNSYRLKEWYF
jgi:hypothetical protein